MHLNIAPSTLATAFALLTGLSQAVLPASSSDFAVLPPLFNDGQQQVIQPAVQSRQHDFTLRHIYHHGTHKHPYLHRKLDVTKDTKVHVLDEDGARGDRVHHLSARSEGMQIQRLADRSYDRIDALLNTGRSQGSPVALDVSAWTVDQVVGPNITDKSTVVTLAKIAGNAYAADNSGVDWEDVKGGFNYTEDFGWENDGLRGHIFADTDNKTVIIGLKGTSPAVFDGSETTANDKINDNLFFSCCCGQGGQYPWKQVCDCQTSAFTCNSTCVVEALRNKNRYYYAAQEIYRNVSKIYSNADVWMVGHSLGGATSALVGLTYGIPAVSFEAPGDAMAASRLGLPTPPGYGIGYHQQRTMTGGYQFGHTADPIYMGTCNTIGSVCTIAGYAMQSVCHSGYTCSYDTVKDFGWRSGAGNHRIKVVVHDVIEKYDKPAECKPMRNCTDCYNWEYFESHEKPGTSKTTSKTSTSLTTTRTTTCKTPGWWGCLDESTTTTKTTTTTETLTSTVCETPGWFGCKDPSTFTTTVTRTIPSEPVSAPAHSPTVTTIPHTTSARSSSSDVPRTTATSTHSHKSASMTETCDDRAWYGRCREWKTIDLEDVKFDL